MILPAPRRRWLRRVLIVGCGSVCLLLLTDLVLVLVGDHRLAAIEARLQAAGAPMTLAEAIPQVPVAENAAPLEEAACLLLTADQGPGASLAGDGLPEPYATLLAGHQFGDAPPADALHVLSSPRFLQIHALLAEAAQRPRCAYTIEWERGAAVQVPVLAAGRDLVRLECLRAEALAARGDAEGTVEDLRIAAALARHTAQCPLLIALITADAESATTLSALQGILQRATPTPAVLHAIAGGLRSEPRWSEAVRALDAERVAFAWPFFRHGLGWWPLRNWDEAAYDQCLLAARTAFAAGQVPAMPVVPRWCAVTQLLLPALTMIGNGIARADRYDSFAQTALALEQARLSGSLPSELAPLLADDPSLAARLGPVRYQRTSAGWTLDATDVPTAAATSASPHPGGNRLLHWHAGGPAAASARPGQ